MCERVRMGVVVVLGMVVGLVGCGSGPEHGFLKQLVPATGRVTVDGKPLGGATVTFSPDIESSGGRHAMATTRDDGTYELSTAVPGVSPEDSKGVVPGEYIVTISKIAMEDGSPFPDDIVDEYDAVSRGAKQFVPPQYTDPGTSPLKVSVAAPKAEHNFEL